MEIGIDVEGVAALTNVMGAHRQALASADQSALVAIGAARGAVTTDLVRNQLTRIEAEMSQAVDKHSNYTTWFISVLEENVAAFIEYEEWVASQIAGFEANPDLTPRFP